MPNVFAVREGRLVCVCIGGVTPAVLVLIVTVCEGSWGVDRWLVIS